VSGSSPGQTIEVTEQRFGAQRRGEQRLAEQRFGAQRLGEQRLAEQQFGAQRLVGSGSVSSGSVRSGSVSSGYAAGCEAKATPRRKGLTNVGLCPSFGLRPKTLGQSPYRGRSPLSLLQSTAGHSPRRTPDGKAEANTPGKDVPSMNAFVCKLSASQEERLVGQQLRWQRLAEQRFNKLDQRRTADETEVEHADLWRMRPDRHSDHDQERHA
jgi:hypothetical protein